ncbi:MAG: DUF3368 domain-containing protein [Chloroflexi bacterium]|nr:DUF3368 domain-containing protein [Chloroflexota bacterium]
MIVVSDTGPLIALAKVNCLSRLKHLFGQIYIPPAVYRELLAKIGPEAKRLDDALAEFITVTAAPPVPLKVDTATARLGSGERQAVALAYERGALLLIDDRQGRSAARRLGIMVSGVVGVLLQAKAAGLVSSIRALLDEMRFQGYWLSDEVITATIQQAGENDD